MQIHFKPDPISSIENWKLASGQLTTPGNTLVELTELTSLRFTDGAFKGRFITFLDLFIDKKLIATINCEDRLSGENRHRCFIFIFEVINSLKKHNPTVLVQCGPSRNTKSVMMMLGAIPALPCLLFGAEAFSAGDYLSAIALFLLSFFIASFMSWGIKPNQASPMLTLIEFEEWLYNQKPVLNKCPS
ncbi:MAG: hypothetical protein AAFP03_06690 [Cyanobacteria bacterium J06598_3]